MWLKLSWLIIRNLLRSKVRLLIGLSGCALAGFVICFFLAAEGSLVRMTATVSQDANLIVRQKDRY
jgi:hypothetical protein